jgi:uroporphyrinogen decarboxylase
MINPVLEKPDPDFARFIRILSGEEEPRSVPLVELGMDHEIQEMIFERYLGEARVAISKETREEAFKQHVTLYHRLGYDYVPTWPEWPGHPPSKSREARDTAEVADKNRVWVEEGQGLITSWEDFEKFPWNDVRAQTGPTDIVAKNLPDGMKITVGCTLYEHVLERLLGYEGLFFLLHDDEELVKEVFSHWGQRVYDYYESVIQREEVGALFHADDLGFKTSTMISPEALRKHVFPWFKKYADLAHDAGKVFYYHCCGNVYQDGVIEDLINDVGIDAYHSFEDVILPITEFKKRYGDRVAGLGGVDMDKLSRLDEKALRVYVRGILEVCMPGGRFALGAGNTVANYVPLENYCIMLDEARKFGK